MKMSRYLVFVIPTLFALACAFSGVNKNIAALKNISNIARAQVETTGAGAAEKKDDAQNSDLKDEVKAEKTGKKSSAWKDGTYSGEAKGYGGIIGVSVEIKNGKIKNIVITEHANETPSFFAKAKSITSDIIKRQSANVDTVSGATYSSEGIRQAVANALNSAAVSDGDKINIQAKTLTVKKKKISSKTGSAKRKINTNAPADGTFTGSALCEKFGYTMSIKVTFKDKKARKIFGLKITNNDDSANAYYWDKAYKPTVKKLLKKQSGDVDVVSGATYSSNAVMEAFENAKSKAIAKNNAKSKKTIKKTAKKKTDKKSNTANVNINNDTQTNSEKVKDGVYRVTAVCTPDSDEEFKKYDLSADVEFSDGKLKNISNFSSSDESNRKYYLKAANGTKNYKGIVEQLVNSQSAANISAVSGATCSSKTIVMLYAQGVSQATGKEADIKIETEMADSSDANQDQSGEESTTGTAETDPLGDTKLLNVKDGSYIETVIVSPDEDFEFDEYSMTTEIVFKSGALFNINILSATDQSNELYYMRALNGTKKKAGILTQLKTDPLKTPDVVGGATCSFNALYEAFEAAKADAKEEQSVQ